MSRFVESTILDDAYSALHAATGLPDTIGGRNQKQFFVRVAVIFGWLSVESIAKFFISEWVASGFRETKSMNLTEKICLLQALRKIREAAVEPLSGIEHTREERELAVSSALAHKAAIELKMEEEKKKFDMVTFKSQRLLRSDITHNNTDREPTVAEVRACLNYCTHLIELAGGLQVRKESSYTASRMLE